MAGIRLNLHQIFEGIPITIGVYVPNVNNEKNPYGVASSWGLFREFDAWYSDSSMSEYSSVSGISAEKITTLYVAVDGQVTNLPSRIGIKLFETEEKIHPSIQVENFYDFNNTCIYALVTIQTD